MTKESETNDEERKNQIRSLIEENRKLVYDFGAKLVSDLPEVPDFYTFSGGLMYSHRDFDAFLQGLKSGKRSAIVSGFNASSSPHVAHLAVFDTNRFFQEKYGIDVYIPISDDESYVAGKVKDQETGLRNALLITRSLAALGFSPSKTRIVIDQLYTNIYNLSFRISRYITQSTVRATYGYQGEHNIGLQFYPSVQSAHIYLPNLFGIDNILVPIGPDEDAHLRVCRDVADNLGYRRPAVLHSRFLPGMDGFKMSKSMRNNAIMLSDSDKELKKRIGMAFSGGQVSVEEHRKLGGDPEIDVSFLYLKYYFLTPGEAEEISERYRAGKMLSGEMKALLTEKLLDRIHRFKTSYDKVTEKQMARMIMANDDIDIEKIVRPENYMPSEYLKK
ncbi:MAG: tryptophan--tRNA ligase [Candidatus Thermoplasmatota archaeon]|nr:tryptophan--tRNA ligase [Candidatus Thermoplasmatota archaeon]